MSAFWGITLLILAVMSGAVLVLVLGLKQKNGSSLIKPLLSFSGGFLISIAFLHFIPAIYSKHTESIGVYILLGFLIQLFLEYFSGGIEHGHVHPTKNGNVPIVLFISLSVHSILEGIPLAAEFIPDALGVHVHDHHGHSHSHDSGHSLLFGIIFHNIPVAIALTTMLIQSGWQRWSTLLILFIFSLTAPLGILIGINAPHLFSGYTADIILAIVVGMFLHISTTIIFETSEGHRFNLMKLVTLLAGAFLGLWFH